MFARFLFAMICGATAGRPYGLCEIFNIASTANHYIPTIRRDRARPCPQQISYKIKSTDNRKGCPYGRKCFQICYIPKAIINTLISSAAASPRPTPSDVISNPCEAPTFAVVRFFKTVYYVLTQPVYYLITLYTVFARFLFAMN